MKILIVDDNPFFRETVGETLRFRIPSLSISEAKDRREALDIIRASLPDIALVGMLFPDGNGLELARQIKESYPSINVVILTDYGYDEYRETALLYKADHFIPKYTFLSMLGHIF